jgi:3-dehydroquinate dehydratase
MILVIECGVAYIDVKIEWPQSMLKVITSKKEPAKVVASYHN